MKKLVATLCIAYLMLPVSSASADLIVYYNFENPANTGNESSEPAASTHALASATGIVRGSGINATALANTLNSSGWTTGATPDLNDYYQFSITSAADTTTNLTTLFFGERRSATGIRDFQWRSSTDNFVTFTNQGSQITVPDDTNNRNQTLTLTGLSGLAGGTTVTFRVYGFNAESGVGTWAMRNNTSAPLSGLYLDGTITAVPEPSSLMLIGISLVATLQIRRNRKA